MKYLKLYNTEDIFENDKESLSEYKHWVTRTLDDNEVHYSDLQTLDGLIFTALEDNVTITIQHWDGNDGDPVVKTVLCAYGNGAWETWGTTSGHEGQLPEITLMEGEILRVKKGTENEYWNSENSEFTFYIEGRAVVSGDITALTKDKDTLGEYELLDLFIDCEGLECDLELPYTHLNAHCYDGMFYNCTSLTTPPALPARELAEGCYAYMFGCCESMTEAPYLPAEILVDFCYTYMFERCSNLHYIKVGFIDYSAVNALNSWVDRIPQEGTFVRPASCTLHAFGSGAIPYWWEVRNPDGTVVDTDGWTGGGPL